MEIHAAKIIIESIEIKVQNVIYTILASSNLQSNVLFPNWANNPNDTNAKAVYTTYKLNAIIKQE